MEVKRYRLWEKYNHWHVREVGGTYKAMDELGLDYLSGLCKHTYQYYFDFSTPEEVALALLIFPEIFEEP